MSTSVPQASGSSRLLKSKLYDTNNARLSLPKYGPGFGEIPPLCFKDRVVDWRLLPRLLLFGFVPARKTGVKRVN